MATQSPSRTIQIAPPDGPAQAIIAAPPAPANNKAAAATRAARDEMTEVVNSLHSERADLRERAGKLLMAAKEDRAARRLIVDNNHRDLVRDRKAREREASNIALNAAYRLDSLRQQTKLLDGGDYKHKVCQVCPFTRSAYLATDNIPTVKAEWEIADAAVNAAVVWKADEIESLCNQLEDLDAAPALTAETACPDIVRQGLAMSAQIQTIEAERDMMSPTADEAHARELREMLDAARAAAHKVEALDGVRTAMATVRDALMRLGEAQDARATQRAELTERLAATANVDNELKKTRADIAVADASVRAIAAQRDGAIAERGAAQTRLADLEAKAAAKVRAEADLEQHDVQARTYDSLERAFGRDGIPQLIVDSALPIFQDILVDLLTHFDGRWAISIQTQAETHNGRVREVIIILVDDGDGPRDIATYSGGERKLLRTILRIAFSSLQAERSGRRLEVFIVDEAFDALDADNAQRMLAVFERVSDWFRQVIIISHSGELLAALPHLIRLSGGKVEAE